MYLHALGTATPTQQLTQSACWDIIDSSPAKQRLSKRSRLILHNILRGDHGIEHRYFAAPEIPNLFDFSADELHGIFRSQGPRLASKALTKALENGSLAAKDIDALLICTCTGYLCPGITSYVSEELGIRSNAFLQDVVGHGCGAAIPTLRAASHILAANPDAVVACVAVEICSAAFYLDDDPGVLISACLFSDGAAATIWKRQPGLNKLRCFGFDTHHVPRDRDKLRFEQKDGKLRNLLDRGVPTLAASAVDHLWQRRGDRPVAGVVAHPGGRDVIEALSPVVAPHSLAASEAVLRQYGNMSSPSVLFALQETLAGSPDLANGDLWLVSFGAGFSAHSCRLGLD